MTGIRTPVDVANRALQLLRRPSIFSFDDPTVEAHETGTAYDALRLAELRRSCWRFSTRRVVLRVLTTTTRFFAAAAWASGTSYVAGDVIAYSNELWVALSDNTGQQPDIVPPGGVLYWDSYFGPRTIDVWRAPFPNGVAQIGAVSTGTYWTDELVYKTPGDGTYTIYRSLINGNNFDPEAVDGWNDSVVYTAGQVVAFDGTNYQSLVDLNFNYQPDASPTQWTTLVTSPLVSNSWRAMSGMTLSPLNIVYPLEVGPSDDPATRNAYALPAGFLRQAPLDPRAGINPFLGAPNLPRAKDWLFENQFIVSRNADPILIRFIADCRSVLGFDSLFAEGLSSRMALELAGRLADGEHIATIIQTCRETYARTITEARTINGIETGPVDSFEDDFITARA